MGMNGEEEEETAAESSINTAHAMLKVWSLFTPFVVVCAVCWCMLSVVNPPWCGGIELKFSGWRTTELLLEIS